MFFGNDCDGWCYRKSIPSRGNFWSQGGALHNAEVVTREISWTLIITTIVFTAVFSSSILLYTKNRKLYIDVYIAMKLATGNVYPENECWRGTVHIQFYMAVSPETLAYVPDSVIYPLDIYINLAKCEEVGIKNHEDTLSGVPLHICTLACMASEMQDTRRWNSQNNLYFAEQGVV